MSSIREMIAERLNEIRDTSTLNPHRAAEIIVELSSLGASLNQELVAAKFAFKEVKNKYRIELKAANQATVAAEATKEYKDWLDRDAQANALIEAVRSLKYYIKVAEVEEKESRY